MVARRYQALRHDVHAFTTFSFPIRRPRLAAFTVADPYRVPGTYRKGQLHLHTSNSPDVREKKPVRETVLAYRRAGYSFVVLTDHDRVTDVAGLADLNTPDFAVLPGEERTLPVITWPLGRHLLRIGIGRDEVRAVAHPSWGGNLGTGRWSLKDLLRRRDYQLIEVLNGKSNSTLDFWLWHKVLERRGYADPVWGIAVDDTDNAEPIDAGWVMVKTAEVSREALLAALRRGSFYATNGALAEFGVVDGAIRAEASAGAWIRFINARNEVVAVFRGDRGEYRPVGDEGFVRVEVESQAGYAAWSQPFFLIPSDGAAEGGDGRHG
ncbi:MAG: hypothetical protein QME79_10440 [Bacillota bacterium]|nr:hypothetical protein [Bacillota bacterium]